MRILLDTSAWSAGRRGHAEIIEICATAEEVTLTPIVLGELLAGFRKGARRRQNELALRGFLEEPRVEVAALDPETADCYAEIVDSLVRSGRMIGTNDVWIAATAMRHALRLVTTDEHFLAVTQIVKDVFPPSRS